MRGDPYTPMSELDALIAMLPDDEPLPPVRERDPEAERIRLAKWHAEHRAEHCANMRAYHKANRETHVQGMRERRRKAKGAV